ncbi:MAG: MBL fold metallo-hydrolase [Weeksellaceae bacterium]
MLEKENEIIFLGTGTSQGVPPIGCTHPVCLSEDPKDKRLRSAVVIKAKGKQILIDCGPDFRQQMLRENLSHVDGVLITHEHNDHIIGLDDMRPILFQSMVKPKIYSIHRVLEAIKMRFPYAFAKHKYPGVPSFELEEVTVNESFMIGGLEVIPLGVLHGKLDILGFRIGDLAYLTDVKTIPKETMPLLQNLEILVIDALRQKIPHHAHLLLDEAIAYAKEINANKTYFTHISHEMGFYAEVEKKLPENMHLAYDQLRLKF